MAIDATEATVAGKHTKTARDDDDDLSEPVATAATSAPTARGRVYRVYAERGFGFIRCTEGGEVGKDYFFHASGLEMPIDSLEEGSLVAFEPRVVAKGHRAERIRPEQPDQPEER
jgi:cold shock CspA family protein